MNIKKAREELRQGKTIYDMPLRVAYYARVSTDKDDQLNSLENQQSYFEDMIADNHNWISCGGYIDEGISGTAVKNRTSFLKMIEDATLGKIDLILTKEISRFSRNTVDSIKYTEYLLKNGVIVYFLSDNLNTIQEDAEFRLTIMSSMAQDEVRKLSERVKFGINRMIKDRKLIGGGLTGYYKKDGRYEINPNEAPIIKYIFESYATGTVSFKKIGEDLANMGYLNSKGEAYSGTAIVKFMTNPRYKGFYTARLSEVEDYKTHKKKIVPKDKQIIERDARVPALVSEELWDRCNDLYNARRKLSTVSQLTSTEMLENSKYTSIMICKHCGAPFIRCGGSNRQINPVWACKTYKKQGKANCLSPIIREEYLDNIFVSLFADFIKNKNDYLNQVLKEYEAIIELNDNTVDVAESNRKIEQIEKQKDKLLDLSLKGIIDDYEFQKRNDKFNQDLALIKKTLDELNNSNNERDKIANKLRELKNNLTEKMDIRKQLPHLIKLLIEKIDVEKVNNDRHHVRLTIHFNFNADIVDKELDLNRKRTLEGLQQTVNLQDLNIFFGKKYTPDNPWVTTVLNHL